MKRIALVVIIVILNILCIQAKQISLEEAQVVAAKYLESHDGASQRRSSLSLNLAYQAVSQATTASARMSPLTYFYLFNIGNQDGIIIISGDDKVVPVLGYTESGSFDAKMIPPHFAKWLENYKSEIRYAIDNLNEGKATKEMWQALLNSETNSSNLRTKTVSPLMATKWDQSPYFNDDAPFDRETNSKSVAGCVATAMAQIMKYWSYPASGTGFHSYNHSKFGTLSANFGGTTYNWAAMPNVVNSPNQAVASLMYQVAVSVDMQYSGTSSGAYVISAESPVRNCSEYAFKTYFGYKDVQGIKRSSYSLANWINMMKAELDAGQPILYAGFGAGGGHAFVADGYTNNDFFHINWGWGGYFDGYFALTALNPEDVGTGGGTGGFNSGQQAVIGIKPPQNNNNNNFDLKLSSSVNIDNSEVYYFHGFTVKNNIINSGSSSFTGDYAAAAFDSDGNFVDFIATLTGYTLPAGHHYTNGLEFATDGLLTLLPGDYRIYTFYKSSGGNWNQLKSSNGTGEFANLKVINPNDIELYSAISIEGGTELINGEAVNIHLDVANFGSSDFNGIVDVSLYNLDGSFAFTIEEKENVSLCSDCHFTNGLSFSNPNLELAPGTYLMAVLHLRDGSENYEITGSTHYTNPIKVIVKAANTQPDSYEDNNELALASNLPVNFAGNTASVSTNDVNIHVADDYDYYKIVLDPGSSYEFKAKVQDSYNAVTGTNFTNDVLFAYSLNGQDWSDAYDDEMPAKITVSNGGTIYFLVSSYFQGETGTYQLDINITKNSITSSPEFPGAEAGIVVYPNPSNGKFFVSSENLINEIKIFDLTGRQVLNVTGTANEVDLTRQEKGVYVMQMSTGQGLTTKRIIKQ